jgi:hypothetical protein
MIPTIRVKIYLTADKFDLAEVTRRIGVIPTRAREKSEWPQVSIDLGFAVDEWNYETPEKQCLSVEESFREMLAIMAPKITVIKELIQEFQLETSLLVIVCGETMNLPEMYLSKEIIAFAASINASIGFDMYLD